MKNIFLSAILCLTSLTAFCQQPAKSDTAYNPKNNDTIRISNILIIKKNKRAKKDTTLIVPKDTVTPKKHPRVSTNYGVFDFGFSNFIDRTNYAAAGSYIVNKPGAPAFDEADMKLRGGKSININIWFFMQKLQLVKNHVNLKYGLGVELNNYQFRSPISFKENGTIPYSGGLQTNAPFVFRDSVKFSKNKLAADYFTIPLMLNFTTAKQTGKPGFSASFGVSGGYLYSQRNKQESTERGKQKNKGDYDMQRFKFSYIGELGVSPVRLYGSYTPNSIFEKGLNIRPYTVGVRFSNW